MKALTIRQPIASAIVEGVTRVINLPWETRRITFQVYADETPWRPAPTQLSRFKRHWPGCPKPGSLPLGSVIGMASVTSCLPVDHPRLRGDPWVKGPWCWLVTRSERYPNPIRCERRNGLWNVPEYVAKQIHRPPASAMCMCRCDRAAADVMALGPSGWTVVCVYCAGLERWPRPGHTG